MSERIKDSNKGHWVNRAPAALRPYLQLSRLDRPVGYWLLALPGWIGLAFAALSYGFAQSDLKWAALILIGAIAMRGAGCTYNDIVDQDLDAQVERTALRPLPAGTVSTKQAWAWLLAQCAIGLVVLFCLPRLAQIISLASIPLVAAYPFMKRITWWPQIWLGMTFNWAMLVAYAAKTGQISTPLLILYAGLIFWTVGYDTIYACQDIEDDMKIGVKSTARRFGDKIKPAISLCFTFYIILSATAYGLMVVAGANPGITDSFISRLSRAQMLTPIVMAYGLLSLHFIWQVMRLDPKDGTISLKLFKSNVWNAAFHILILLGLTMIWQAN